MKYQKILKGEFVSRPNRFIAKVKVKGEIETVHVKNTGRCKELLQEGAVVYLEESDHSNRKTKFDLIAVEKQTKSGTILVNMDSQAPNQVAFEWLSSCALFSENAMLTREVKYGSSRFDIFVLDGHRKAFIEVKGVTLENEGVAMFPDAPTERGVKHVKELMKAVKDGYEAYALFVIQMKGVHTFTPNVETHKEFAEALREAQTNGVKILAVDCKVGVDSLIIDQKVPFVL